MRKILNRLNDLLSYDDAKPIKDYLDKRVSEKVQNKVKFGYFPPSKKIPDLLLSDISIDELIDNKLAYVKNIDTNLYSSELIVSFFEHHQLIIPYYDVYDNLIAFAGRTLLSVQEQKELKIPKYKNTIFNKGSHLFGLNWAKESILQKDSVIIVEGQIDVLTAMDYGIDNVVAVGSSSLSEGQLALIMRYTNNINILFDNDIAGKKGYDLLINKYSKYASFNKINLPEHYKDLDEYLLDGNSMI